MKHLKLFEENINTRDELYLFHWDDGGYSIYNKGWIQRNSEQLLVDGEDIDTIKKILDIGINERYNTRDDDEQKLNGYIEWIEKVKFNSAPIDPDFDVKIETGKYNL